MSVMVLARVAESLRQVPRRSRETIAPLNADARLADYRSKVRKPDDFDAFWEGVMQQAAAIPLAPEMVLDPLRTSDDVEVFQVFYSSLDHLRIAAWYCRPARLTRADSGHPLLAGLPDGPTDSQGVGAQGIHARSPSPRAASCAVSASSIPAIQIY